MGRSLRVCRSYGKEFEGEGGNSSSGEEQVLSRNIRFGARYREGREGVYLGMGEGGSVLRYGGGRECT